MADVLNININLKKKTTALNIFTKAVCVLVEAFFALFCINVGLKMTNIIFAHLCSITAAGCK